ncbi:hypothetical protein [Paucibacter sp. Y2R2-4]|uniref:hypothetical protein n=1 Tax=Paucibacter sp. Y2R2-4 TaxID=2893553 RepID=UPI0021E36591|nr:hypothetical protein [Paucibacter sp. Y2R2-4]MCV2350916.1 hypothetical protein [Paucibacter sp. Y2R2-4]
MPELALPPPASQALLREGAALGVWRLCAALHGREATQSGQWYSAKHALAADQRCNVLVLPRSERAAGIMLRFGDLAGEMGHLDHPVIKVPTDSGVTNDGQPYMIFAAAEGQPIARACTSLPLRERLQLIVQLCDALRHAHQQGWLLAEIDPAMLWVDSSRKLSLMAMGLLPMPDPADPFERGQSLGSAPGFASPETLAGDPPSLVSEVYGVGALMCLLVDGRLPSQFGADPEAASPASSWPGLSAVERFSLDALCAKAVAPRASRRHAGVEALAEDLRAWLAGENHSALALTPMPATAASMERESDVATWPPQTHPLKKAAGAVAVLASLAGLSWGAWQGLQVWQQSQTTATHSALTTPSAGRPSMSPNTTSAIPAKKSAPLVSTLEKSPQNASHAASAGAASLPATVSTAPKAQAPVKLKPELLAQESARPVTQASVQSTEKAASE